MRPVLTPDQDLLGEDQPKDLVLGTPALLGIFLAVALVCAACFGFGYSSGHFVRRSAQQAPVAPPVPARTPAPRVAQAAPAPETADTTEAAAPGEEQGFPPATTAAAAAAISPRKPAPGIGLPFSPAAGAQEAPLTRRTTAAPQGTPGSAPPVALPAVGAGAVVQIAAVTHAADAETLAEALRHDGFSAIVRTSTTDTFFHVQIGPFPSLEAAKVMRTRLADSGYNAFIKP